MDNKDIVYDVIDFCFRYGIFTTPANLDKIEKVGKILEDPAFVEELIGVTMEYTTGYKDTNFTKNKKLYLGLNDLRFDLEYKNKE